MWACRSMCPIVVTYVYQLIEDEVRVEKIEWRKDTEHTLSRSRPPSPPGTAVTVPALPSGPGVSAVLLRAFRVVVVVVVVVVDRPVRRKWLVLSAAASSIWGYVIEYHVKRPYLGPPVIRILTSEKVLHRKLPNLALNAHRTSCFMFKNIGLLLPFTLPFFVWTTIDRLHL
ncbi:hypothetical protein JOM56_009141 [Amanita muscaria]